MLYLILWAAIAAVIVGADQLTKYLVIQHIPLEGSVTVIEGVLRWTHIKNDGAMMGMLDGAPWVYMVLSTVGIALMIGMLIWWCKKEPKDKLMQVILTLLISGGIGNMIDRCLTLPEPQVTDFIDFSNFFPTLWSWISNVLKVPVNLPNLWVWIFNVADCAVTIGGGLMILWLILSVVKEIKQKKQAETALPEEKDGDATHDSDAQS